MWTPLGHRTKVQWQLQFLMHFSRSFHAILKHGEIIMRQTFIFAQLLAASVTILIAGNDLGHAEDFVSRPGLTLEGARRVIAAAVAEASRNGWSGVIAVVDSAGMTIAMDRMDNAAVPGGVDIAPGKARSAALFRRPTSDLENAINGPRAALATAGHFVMMTGGLPIIEKGQVVGAIGVSAETPQHDEIIAKAGLAALGKSAEVK
jgi:glc operon protein GlcG